jgi:hypothetical protein
VATAYYIVGWHDRYEPRYRRGTELRKWQRPLDYYHAPVHQGNARAEAFKRFGPLRGLAVIGFFDTLCQLAARQEEPQRGWLLDQFNRPLGARDIANLLGLPKATVSRHLDMVCALGWASLVDCAHSVRTVCAQCAHSVRTACAQCPPTADSQQMDRRQGTEDSRQGTGGKAAAVAGGASPPARSVDLIDLLLRADFDRSCASKLATEHPRQRIVQALAQLGKAMRKGDVANPQGYLRTVMESMAQETS